MKKYLIILFLFIPLFSGCGTPKFSSESKNTGSERYKKEKKEPVSTENKQIRKKENSNPGALKKLTGVASFYSEKFHGRKTANGETYDMHALTAAHETYPFNTVVKVINLKNNKSVILRINDRKPDFNGRIIDVSLKAAQELGMVISGIAHVQVEVLEWGK